MKISQLENKHILIAGYGIEGKATEVFIKQYVSGARISIADKSTGSDYLSKQHEYDIVIKTPGIPPSEITAPYTTATNIFFANLPSKNQTIGVTGSKGKSTTTSLIYHILKHAGKKVQLAGNIGKPLLSVFDPLDNNIIYVAELSSYQLADIAFSPHISVIVSLFPEHIPYHGSEAKYYAAKKNILAHASQEDYYIYNPAYPLLKKWSQETQAKTRPFATGISHIPTKLVGQHNQDNIQAAATVALLYDIPDSTIISAVASFEPLPHRLQTVGVFQGITFIDDAISTSPESTIAALDAIPHVKTLFLGGEDRGYDFSQLIKKLIQKDIEHVVVFPDSGNRIAEELHIAYPDRIAIYHAHEMQSAVHYAFEHTPPGAVCLLSCASPSYSLWKDFQEKGNQFQTFIRNYVS